MSKIGAIQTSSLDRQAQRIYDTVQAVPWPMVAMYRITHTQSLKVETYRDGSPELGRLDASGWKIVGCYQRGITRAAIASDLAACA